MQFNTKRTALKLTETIFDVLYLGTVLISAVILCFTADVGSERWRFGLMALILGIGDSFHLIPRICAMWGGKNTVMLGVGKLIASVTMTVFYVILWTAGASLYPELVTIYMTTLVYTLAGLRIVLCLLPQNRWTSEDSPLKWAIGRNVPFFALGMLVTLLFAKGTHFSGNFPFIWLAVLFSFACYIPVVLFSHRNPKVGMLMLLKSCAYAAIVLMGFTFSGA